MSRSANVSAAGSAGVTVTGNANSPPGAVRERADRLLGRLLFVRVR
jgi:hypothetical protein